MFTRNSTLVAALVLGVAASAALAAAMDPDVRARQETMGMIGAVFINAGDKVRHFADAEA